MTNSKKYIFSDFEKQEEINEYTLYKHTTENAFILKKGKEDKLLTRSVELKSFDKGDIEDSFIFKNDLEAQIVVQDYIKRVNKLDKNKKEKRKFTSKLKNNIKKSRKKEKNSEDGEEDEEIKENEIDVENEQKDSISLESDIDETENVEVSEEKSESFVSKLTNKFSKDESDEVDSEENNKDEVDNKEKRESFVSKLTDKFSKDESDDVDDEENNKNEVDDEENSESVISKLTNKFSKGETQFKVIDDNDNINKEKNNSESESFVSKLTDKFSKDESDEVDNEENNTDDSKSFVTKLKEFIKTNIDDLEQDSMTSRNIRINYFEYYGEKESINKFLDISNWGYSKYIKEFKNNSKDNYSGDKLLKSQSNKLRFLGLLKSNSYARNDFITMVLPLILIFVGLMILVLSIIVNYTGDIDLLRALSESSSYGDIMVLFTIFMLVSSIILWFSRRFKQKTIYNYIHKPIVGIAGFILTVQILIVLYISYLVLTGGQEALLGLELRMDGYMESIASLIPIIGDSIYQTYLFYRGDEVLFNVSLIQSSILIIIVGLVTIYPELRRNLSRYILASSSSSEDFITTTELFEDELKYYQTEKINYIYDLSSGSEISVDDVDLDISEELEEDDEKTYMGLPDVVRESPLEDYYEFERYWVNEPYAYVSILHNAESGDYVYTVVEPELTQSEEIIFEQIKELLDTALLFEDVKERKEKEQEKEQKLKQLRNKVVELSKKQDLDIQDETFHKILYYVERDYVEYNKIDPIMKDTNIEDISCTGEENYLFVFHSKYNNIETNVKFKKEKLKSFIQELANRSGENINAAEPIVDSTLPDGSRVNLTLGSEVTTDGSTFTIRLFKDIPFTPVDLLYYNTFSVRQMAYLWLAIENNKSLIFAGGTASGKTTSMNAVSLFIPPKAKVVTIEDTREIMLPLENWIPGTTREGLGGKDEGEITMFTLLKAALRQRPEYIIVGEIRGAEAETLFQAMNTGHTTYSTMHADSVQATIGRLTNPPINVPRQMITALDIICIQNQVRMIKEGDTNLDNVRRNQKTMEIVDMKDDGTFDVRRSYLWDAETDSFIETLEDSNVCANIKREKGWTDEELEKELDNRTKALQYMLDNDIRDFEHVSNIIQRFIVDSEKILHKIETDTLEPEKLGSLTNVQEPHTKDNELNEIAEEEVNDYE